MKFQELLSPYNVLSVPSVASTYEFPCSLSSSTIAVLDHFLLGSCTETRWPGLNFARSLESVHLLLFFSALSAASSRARMSIGQAV